MYDFILQIALIVSVGAIIYLFARALPRLPEAETAPIGTPNAVERILRRIPLAKIDAALSAFLEKTLRKMRVLVLKTENLVSAGIRRMRKKA
ncbi:MAG: hypothetical protein HYW56_01590, partial [Candidatus Harrisonbacteria bacterium]|nr:hypothetical protein [Candidatus Harrisonbacteria bacterium]